MMIELASSFSWLAADEQGKIDDKQHKSTITPTIAIRYCTFFRI
jgi:hypothetical protein